MNKQQFQELFQKEYNRDSLYKLFSATFANFNQLAKPAENINITGDVTLGDFRIKALNFHRDLIKGFIK